MKEISEIIESAVRKEIEENFKENLDSLVRSIIDKRLNHLWDNHIEDLKDHFSQSIVKDLEYLISIKADNWDIWADKLHKRFASSLSLLLSQVKFSIAQHIGGQNALSQHLKKVEQELLELDKTFAEIKKES